VRNRIRKATGRGLRTAGPHYYFACPLRSRSESSARNEVKVEKQKFHELKQEKSRQKGVK
jgi:hypothetical protein